MIKCVYDRDRLRIEMTGHAGGRNNELGHDLVCCAASTLVQTYFYAGSRLGHVMEMQMEHGHMMVQLDPDATASAGFDRCFDTAVLGLMMIEEYHPNCIRVTSAVGDSH